MRIVLFATAALLFSAPAAANVYLATYTGVLTGDDAGSYDISGLFGAPRQSLVGLAYRAEFRIDDGIPGAPIYVGLDPSGYRPISELHGGSSFGTTAQPVTAKVTINGHTVAVDGSERGVAQQDHSIYDDATYHYVKGYYGTSGTAGGDNYVYFRTYVSRLNGFLTSQDLRTPIEVDLSAVPAIDAAGGFSIYQLNALNPYGVDKAYGIARLDHLSIAVADATVPEPAAWTLMIGGFGVVGAALRRRPSFPKGATRCA